MTATTVQKLNVPIMAHGDQITELEVRRPTTKEVRAIKALPYTLSENSMPVVEPDVVCKYIAVCAGIPQSSVEQLDLADLNALAWVLIGFFMTPASTPQTA
jgi:Phage tail assembly chaperone proteins, E, or 41 or 14